jgi:hypothetical protein
MRFEKRRAKKLDKLCVVAFAYVSRTAFDLFDSFPTLYAVRSSSGPGLARARASSFFLLAKCDPSDPNNMILDFNRPAFAVCHQQKEYAVEYCR